MPTLSSGDRRDFHAQITRYVRWLAVAAAGTLLFYLVLFIQGVSGDFLVLEAGIAVGLSYLGALGTERQFGIVLRVLVPLFTMLVLPLALILLGGITHRQPLVGHGIMLLLFTTGAWVVVTALVEQCTGRIRALVPFLDLQFGLTVRPPFLTVRHRETGGYRLAASGGALVAVTIIGTLLFVFGEHYRKMMLADTTQSPPPFASAAMLLPLVSLFYMSVAGMISLFRLSKHLQGIRPGAVAVPGNFARAWIAAMLVTVTLCGMAALLLPKSAIISPARQIRETIADRQQRLRLAAEESYFPSSSYPRYLPAPSYAPPSDFRHVPPTGNGPHGKQSRAQGGGSGQQRASIPQRDTPNAQRRKGEHQSGPASPDATQSGKATGEGRAGQRTGGEKAGDERGSATGNGKEHTPQRKAGDGEGNEKPRTGPGKQASAPSARQGAGDGKQTTAQRSKPAAKEGGDAKRDADKQPRSAGATQQAKAERSGKQQGNRKEQTRGEETRAGNLSKEQQSSAATEQPSTGKAQQAPEKGKPQGKQAAADDTPLPTRQSEGTEGADGKQPKRTKTAQSGKDSEKQAKAERPDKEQGAAATPQPDEPRPRKPFAWPKINWRRAAIVAGIVLAGALVLYLLVRLLWPVLRRWFRRLFPRQAAALDTRSQLAAQLKPRRQRDPFADPFGSDQQADAVLATSIYESFLAYLWLAGHERRPSSTAFDFADDLVGSTLDQRAIGVITRACVRAHFGQLPFTAEEREDLHLAWQHIASQVTDGLPQEELEARKARYRRMATRRRPAMPAGPELLPEGATGG